MFSSFDEFGTWFKLRFWVLWGGLALVGVLTSGIARACKIASCTNLLVFSCAIVHALVILCRSLYTLFVEIMQFL